MGNFNLSHASLTSGAALTALHELLKTKPVLYTEITTGIIESTADDEPAFSIKTEADAGDGSDIAIEVVQAVVMSQGSAAIDGFRIDEQGSVVRTGVVENESTTEATTPELPIELGCGCQAKTRSKKYGAEWEGH
jgi:hypothetical protein